MKTLIIIIIIIKLIILLIVIIVINVNVWLANALLKIIKSFMEYAINTLKI